MERLDGNAGGGERSILPASRKTSGQSSFCGERLVARGIAWKDRATANVHGLIRLVVGEYVFAAAQAGGDGALTAQRVQVSKDGVRPPQ